jgi:hypothetical protein
MDYMIIIKLMGIESVNRSQGIAHKFIQSVIIVKGSIIRTAYWRILAAQLCLIMRDSINRLILEINVGIRNTANAQS